jgi:hypothetical protein
MKKQHGYALDKTSALIYLTWELGVRRGREQLARCKERAGLLVMPLSGFGETRREAERWAQRAVYVVGRQRGRIRRDQMPIVDVF